MIVINKLTFTPKKTVLEFVNDEMDPFDKKCEQGPLPETIQSHVDAIANYIYEEHLARYEEDKKQIPLGFNDEEEEESDPTVFDEDPATDPYDQDDYSDIKVPLHEGTTIPDLRSMEQLHAEWYVRQYEDAKDLIGDFKYCYDKELKDNSDLLGLQRQAMTILQGK